MSLNPKSLRWSAIPALVLSLSPAMSVTAHATESTVPQSPSVITRAEELAVGGMLENKKTGERLGIACVKYEEKTIGETKARVCSDVQFFRANAADQELSIELIGKTYSPGELRDTLGSLFYAEKKHAYDSSLDYLSLCPASDSFGSGCVGTPVFGFELTVGYAAAVSYGVESNTPLIGVGYMLIPATVALDLAKDAIADPALLAFTGVVDLGVATYNAGNAVVVASKNGAANAKARRSNRKSTESVGYALSKVQNGASIPIKHRIFDGLVDYLSQCDQAWARNEYCQLKSIAVN